MCILSCLISLYTRFYNLRYTLNGYMDLGQQLNMESIFVFLLMTDNRRNIPITYKMFIELMNYSVCFVVVYYYLNYVN
jgi:hypothetical protein